MTPPARSPLLRSLLIAALLLTTLAVPAMAQGRKVALVIGNGSYRHAPALAAMRRALRSFGDSANGAEVALLYFAGHGMQMGRRDRAENYLLPVDATLQDARDTDDEALALSKVMDFLEGAQNRIIVLDACGDNPLAQRMANTGATRSASRGLAPPESAGSGTLVAFATAPGSVAADGTGRNSPFTSALLEHLGTPGLDAQALFTRVRQRVHETTSGRQVPWNNDALLRPVYLAGLPAGAAAVPAPAPAPASANNDALDLAFWQSIQASRNVADFEEYRRQFPQGRFAGLALNRIGDLRGAGTQPAAQTGTAPPANPPTRGYPVAVGQSFRDQGCPGGCPELTVIPAGSYMMGSPDGEAGRELDEGPRRRVTLREPLALGRFHVTVAEYRAFADATRRADATSCYTVVDGQWRDAPGRNWRSPGFQQTDREPVVCVSWDDAQAYAAWLTQRTGQGYRLPSEAEWEWAARGRQDGVSTRWWWGEDGAAQCRNANGADQTGYPGNAQAAPCADGFSHTSAVGRFGENGFRLHDMAGNAWQWLEDC